MVFIEKLAAIHWMRALFHFISFHCYYLFYYLVDVHFISFYHAFCSHSPVEFNDFEHRTILLEKKNALWHWFHLTCAVHLHFQCNFLFHFISFLLFTKWNNPIQSSAQMKFPSMWKPFQWILDCVSNEQVAQRTMYIDRCLASALVHEIKKKREEIIRIVNKFHSWFSFDILTFRRKSAHTRSFVRPSIRRFCCAFFFFTFALKSIFARCVRLFLFFFCSSKWLLHACYKRHHEYSQCYWSV